jgi:hypothetical protein
LGWLWSTERRAYLTCVGLGIMLALPALAAPFAIDDFSHIAGLEGAARAPVRWCELFTFSPAAPARRQLLITSGALPWWTAPDLRLAFFRPLSSALVTFDHALFGRTRSAGTSIHSPGGARS